MSGLIETESATERLTLPAGKTVDAIETIVRPLQSEVRRLY